MWATLAALWASISWIHIVVIVILAIAAVIISKIGNLSVAWNKTKISFGKKQGRSCRDCILLMLSKKEQHEVAVDAKRNSILRDQMNFVEQKIQEMIFNCVDSYNQQQKEAGEDDLVRIDKEITLYSEALKNMLSVVKDEVRRSFKENGFHTLDTADFNEYIRDKTSGLISLGKNYLIGHYPHQGMIVSLSDRFKKIDQSEVRDLVEEVFMNAREQRNQTEEEIKQLDIEFAEEMDDFIKET